jgi:hypothetical protein
MKWLGILAALIVGAVVVYRVAFPSTTVRYRLTLEVQVDGEPKIGSGVIEVTYRNVPQLWATSDLSIDVRGEAVTLDLGSRGTLFCLLRGNDDYWQGAEGIVPYAFGLGGFPRPIPQGIAKVRQLSGKVDLPLDRLPLLVRFRDLSDPKTVEKVDPLNIAGNFGAGARLLRASVEIVPSGIWPLNRAGITGEPISTGIERNLSWLPEYYDRRFDGQRYEMASSPLRFANSLSSGSFKAGL